MEDTVGIEMAKGNPVVMDQFAQKRMRRNPETPNKERFKNNELIGVGVGNASPAAGRHPPVT